LLLAEMATARLLARKAAKPGSIESLSPSSILTEYATNPIGFAHDILGIDFWSKQQEIAGSVAVNVRTAARSGHKVGKTELAAALLLWWCCTRINARGIFTAPTLRQVEEALWAAVRRQAEGAKRRGYNIIPDVALSPSTGVRWDDGRRLFGFTASHPDKVSGPSGANILFVLDEASGIEAGIWQAVQGILGGTDESSGRVLAIGNPTQPSGWFFDAFNEKRDLWNQPIRISSAESPNVISGVATVPGLATRTWVREMAEEYGEDSPIYQVRVLGDFPTSSANQVISLGLVEGALARWADPDISDDCQTVELGVDVARFGDDDSAIAGRRGLRLYTPAWFERECDIKAVVNGYDAIKVAAIVAQCINALARAGELIRVKVDVTGGFGEPVCAMLDALKQTKQIPEHVHVSRINFAGASSDLKTFPVLRDELWFGGRRFFKEGAMYRDPKAESELIAPTYAPDLQGRNKVEKKRDTKKRLGRSPDRADAVLLAAYEPGGTAPIDTTWSEDFESLTRIDP
jgi:phage terminase large subunit